MYYFKNLTKKIKQLLYIIDFYLLFLINFIFIYYILIISLYINYLN